jgi:hypothetical protein
MARPLTKCKPINWSYIKQIIVSYLCESATSLLASKEENKLEVLKKIIKNLNLQGRTLYYEVASPENSSSSTCSVVKPEVSDL